MRSEHAALPLQKGKLNTSFMLIQLRGKHLHMHQYSVQLTLDETYTDRLWVGFQFSNSLPSVILWSPNLLALVSYGVRPGFVI